MSKQPPPANPGSPAQQGWVKDAARAGRQVIDLSAPSGRPSRVVHLRTLTKLGDQLDGASMREVFTDGRDELLVSRDHLPGHDIAIVVEREGELEVVAWAAATPKGTFAKPSDDATRFPVGTIRGIERGM